MSITFSPVLHLNVDRLSSCSSCIYYVLKTVLCKCRILQRPWNRLRAGRCHKMRILHVVLLNIVKKEGVWWTVWQGIWPVMSQMNFHRWTTAWEAIPNQLLIHLETSAVFPREYSSGKSWSEICPSMHTLLLQCRSMLPVCVRNSLTWSCNIDLPWACCYLAALFVSHCCCLGIFIDFSFTDVCRNGRDKV